LVKIHECGPVQDNLKISGVEHHVDGIISANLAKSRKNKKIKDAIPDHGRISSKAQEELANNLISYIYKKTNGTIPIIGCGGVFTGEDAYKKIKLGSSLIQMITGMIYQGPQIIGKINKDLVKLLRADGYSSISEAIGTARNKLLTKSFPIV
jgi:dihydroorotate dehydrogenase